MRNLVALIIVIISFLIVGISFLLNLESFRPLNVNFGDDETTVGFVYYFKPSDFEITLNSGSGMVLFLDNAGQTLSLENKSLVSSELEKWDRTSIGGSLFDLTAPESCEFVRVRVRNEKGITKLTTSQIVEFVCVESIVPETLEEII